MKREIKDLQLPDRGKRRGKPNQPTLHYRILQQLVFAVEKRLRILALLDRDRCAPDESFVFILRAGERIAKTFNAVGMGENQVNGKLDLDALEDIVEPGTQHFRELFDLSLITFNYCLGVNGQHEAIQGTIRSVLLYRIDERGPFIAVDT